MSTATVLIIAIPVLVVLAGIVLISSMRRRDTGEAIGLLSRETVGRDTGRVAPTTPEVETGTAVELSGRDVENALVVERSQAGLAKPSGRTPVAWVPPDPELIGVTRRQFFNRSIVALMGISLAGFGASLIGFLWPQAAGGFGSKIKVGKIADIKTQIAAGKGFYYYPEGRMWITEYPAAALEKARAVYSPGELAGMEHGIVALYQKCPHLGCRVPSCVTSQWFECPCHGSQYNQVGEKKGGPAPRGMDRFTMSVDNDVLTVDTSTGARIQGPPIGTNTTGQEAEGPHCLSGGGAHH